MSTTLNEPHVHDWWQSEGCEFCGTYREMCKGEVLNPETQEMEECCAWRLMNSLGGIIKQERRSIPREKRPDVLAQFIKKSPPMGD